MGPQVGWVEPLGISKVSHTVLARLIESQIRHQPTGSVWGGLSKGTLASAHLMPDTSVSPYVPLVPFKLPPQCWSSVGVSLSKWVHVWVPQEELLRTLVVSSTDSISAGFYSQKFWGLFPVTGTLGWGAWCGSGTPCSWDIPPKFSSTWMWGWSDPYPCPFYQSGGCGFFNSVVVRFPFNSISDITEWWLFYILVVIVVWLWEEASHVYPCRHLDAHCFLHSP